MHERDRYARTPGDSYSYRRRFEEGRYSEPRDGSRMLLTVVLGLSVLLFVSALSLKQATEPKPAQRVLESGIASITDIDLLLIENLDALRNLARNSDANTFRLPGYPVAVELSRDEILNRSPEELRTILLQRSSVIVYDQGLSAFDTTGERSLGFISAQRILDVAVGRLSKSTNQKAELSTYVLGFLVAAMAVGVVFVGSGMGRLRLLGAGILGGALPGLAVVLLVRLIASSSGGSDPFVSEVRSIIKTLLDVPLRNFLVVAGLGLLFLIASPVLAAIESRLPAPAEEEWDDEGSYDDWSEDEEVHPAEIGRV